MNHNILLSNILANVSVAYRCLLCTMTTSPDLFKQIFRCPHYQRLFFLRWFDNFTCLHTFKILFRLLGIWPCYDKNASACFWNKVNFVGFLVIHISQGSVVTYVRCGGMSTQRCIANFPLSLSVKEFLKSVKI